MDIFQIEEDEPIKREFIKKERSLIKIRDSEFVLEEHEIGFLKRVKDCSYSIMEKLDNFEKSNDIEIIIPCKNSFERAIIHIECKVRHLYSVRTTPKKVKAICNECKNIKRLVKYSGKYWYEYERTSQCGSCTDPTVILCSHIEGVKVNKNGSQYRSKRNLGRNINNSIRHKHNYNNKVRKTLIIQIIHTSILPKDLKRLLYSYLKDDNNKRINRLDRTTEIHCY